MRSAARAAIAVGLTPPLAGCATSLSVGASPNVDNKGRFGNEERVELSGATGDASVRAYAALAGGAGYLAAPGAGYALVSPEAGFEAGHDVRWSVGAFYATRIFFGGAVGSALGPGAAGQLLFRVKSMGGEDGALAIGPRLSLETIGDVELQAGRAPDNITLVQLGIVVRWITFDTTAKPLSF